MSINFAYVSTDISLKVLDCSKKSVIKTILLYKNIELS